MTRVYKRVSNSDYSQSINRLKMSSVLHKAQTDQSPAALMRDMCNMYDCGSSGDLFPADKVSQAQLASLMAEGYVYSLGVGDTAVYKTAFMP